MNDFNITITLPKTALKANDAAEVTRTKNLLNKNPQVNSLDLRNRNIGITELKVLGEILKDNKTITNLDLRNNNINDQGAEILANCLVNNSTLTTINLLNNRITNMGAHTLAGIIKTTTLDNLYLGGNYITSSGIQGFKQNNRLTLSW